MVSQSALYARSIICLWHYGKVNVEILVSLPFFFSPLIVLSCSIELAHRWVSFSRYDCMQLLEFNLTIHFTEGRGKKRKDSHFRDHTH